MRQWIQSIRTLSENLILKLPGIVRITNFVLGIKGKYPTPYSKSEKKIAKTHNPE